jgi:FkbM family methyltransferase
MRRLIQQVALRLYDTTPTQALLRTSLGRHVFESAYTRYKLLLEAPGVRRICRDVPADAWFVDVGANIGVLTIEFARSARGSGRVIAIEPEPVNFSRLVARVNQQGLAAKVFAHRAAATNGDGWANLEIHPEHPGDHRLSSNGGERVQSIRVDTLVHAAGDPKVGLLKIDVQGAEEQVLLGSRHTLRSSQPVVMVEIDERALSAFGSSGGRIVDLLSDFGYRIGVVQRRRLKLLSNADLRSSLSRAELGYLDVLALPAAHALTRGC